MNTGAHDYIGPAAEQRTPSSAKESQQCGVPVSAKSSNEVRLYLKMQGVIDLKHTWYSKHLWSETGF